MLLFKTLKTVPPATRVCGGTAATMLAKSAHVNRNGRIATPITSLPILRFLVTPRSKDESSRPAPGDAAMKVLPPPDRECVRKASLILRLARASNLGRRGAVSRTRVKVSEARVSLVLLSRTRASVDLELWAVEKESSYFLEVFGRELSAAAA
jgi:hypothetical protein